MRRSPAKLQGVSEKQTFQLGDDELFLDLQRLVASWQTFDRRHNGLSKRSSCLTWNACNHNLKARVQDGPRFVLISCISESVSSVDL